MDLYKAYDCLPHVSTIAELERHMDLTRTV